MARLHTNLPSSRFSRTTPFHHYNTFYHLPLHPRIEILLISYPRQAILLAPICAKLISAMEHPASPKGTPTKAQREEEADISTIISSDEPPPPYLAASSTSITNPGFCDLAFRERYNNRLPGGGMHSSQYPLPCEDCGFVCGDKIPSTYKIGWHDWVDPSVNFRWESHTGSAMVNGEKKELLGCWICWEFDGNWQKPMFAEEWYTHIRKHFKVDGYMICKGKVGAMQRRRNCAVLNCPKIHS